MTSRTLKIWIPVIAAVLGGVTAGLFELLKRDSPPGVQIGHLGDNNVSIRGGDTYYPPPAPAAASPNPGAVPAAPAPAPATVPPRADPAPTGGAPSAPHRTDLGAPSAPATAKPAKPPAQGPRAPASPDGGGRPAPPTESRAGDRDRVVAITIDGRNKAATSRVIDEEISVSVQAGARMDAVATPAPAVATATAAPVVATATMGPATGTSSPWSLEDGCGSMDGTHYVDPPGPHPAITCHARAGDVLREIACPACDTAGGCAECVVGPPQRIGE